MGRGDAKFRTARRPASSSGGHVSRELTASLLVCLASVLIVLSVGSASAVSPPRLTTTTEKAPYTGVGLGIVSSDNYLCEAGTKVLKFPEFNTSTGKAQAGGNATSTSCQYPPGPKPLTYQGIELLAGFQSSNITGLKGLVHLKTHWKLSFQGNLRVQSGGKGEFAAALAEVAASGELLNVSSDNEYGFSASVLNYQVNTTTGTDVPIQVSNLVVTQYLNETLSSKSTYALITYVVILLQSEVSLSGSSVAYSEIQLYGSGEGASLTAYSY